MVTVPSIAVLRATNALSNPVVWVEGYSSLADGGEGMFVYVATDTSSSENGGTIIVSMSAGVSYRYYRSDNKDVLNVCWFGASINSASDSSAAVNSALAALPNAGGQIYFPPGSFTFASAITFNFPSGQTPFSVTFIGGGADATTLYWPSTNGLVLNLSEPSHSIHVRDLTFTTSQSCKYNGVTLTQSNYGYPYYQSDFVRVNFRGQTPITEYWGNAIAITGLSNVAYDTLLIYGGNSSGTGINLSGDSSSEQFSVVHNLAKCTFFNGNIGLNYGGYVQGVTVLQCNFTNIDIGINVPSGVTGGIQLAVVASQFGVSQYGIYTEGNMGAASIMGCLFFVQASASVNNSAINLDSFAGGFAIIGNQFIGTGGSGGPYGTAITTGSDSFYGVVIGNEFSSLNVGVNLTGAYQWNVQANSYNVGSGTTVTTPVIPGNYNFVGFPTK